MSQGDPPRVDLGRIRTLSALIAVACLAACLAMGWLWPSRLFPAYLVGFLYWVGVALGCLSIVMLHHLVGGAWGLAVRRPMEAGAMALVPIAVLFVPIGFGLRWLYPWADPSLAAASEAIRRKAGYLNVQAFLIRAVGYFVIWIVLAWLLNRWSGEQDREASGRATYRMQAASGPGIVLVFATATLAMIDWVMSLEPEWASTIFGAMLIVGQGLAAFALVTGVASMLVRSGAMAGIVRRETLGDLGNLLLAFVMLWAYMAFSQFLIIWSGNLPEEITWYVRRTNGGWRWVAGGLIAFHFFAPFFVLLFHEAKRRPGVLIGIAVAILVMHFVDVCWLILPARYEPRASRVPWAEIGLALVATAGIGGVFVATLCAGLAGRPLYPIGDPAMESLSSHETGRHSHG